MSEIQLREILVHIDATLEVFRKQEGRLSLLELSMKSMITTLRSQIELQLSGALPRSKG